MVVRHQLQRYRDVGRNLVQRNAVRGAGRSSSPPRDRAFIDKIPCLIAEQLCHRLSERAHRRIDLRRIGTLSERDARYTCHVPCHRAELRLVHRVERDLVAGLHTQRADKDAPCRIIVEGEVRFRCTLRLCKAEELIASFLENGAVDGRVANRQVNQLIFFCVVGFCAVLPALKHHRGGVRHQIEPAIAIGRRGQRYRRPLISVADIGLLCGVIRTVDRVCPRVARRLELRTAVRRQRFRGNRNRLGAIVIQSIRTIAAGTILSGGERLDLCRGNNRGRGALRNLRHHCAALSRVSLRRRLIAVQLQAVCTVHCMPRISRHAQPVSAQRRDNAPVVDGITGGGRDGIRTDRPNLRRSAVGSNSVLRQCSSPRPPDCSFNRCYSCRRRSAGLHIVDSAAPCRLDCIAADRPDLSSVSNGNTAFARDLAVLNRTDLCGHILDATGIYLCKQPFTISGPLLLRRSGAIIARPFLIPSLSAIVVVVDRIPLCFDLSPLNGFDYATIKHCAIVRCRDRSAIDRLDFRYSVINVQILTLGVIAAFLIVFGRISVYPSGFTIIRIIQCRILRRERRARVY